MLTDSQDLDLVARRIRGEAVWMSHRARAPHLGSALSCVDILVAAYWRVLRVDAATAFAPDRDRFILSKGHAASSLYATLAYRGFLPQEELATYGKPGGRLPEQPCPGSIPGLEAATGSLGHGLSLGVGMALAGRIQRWPYRVLVVMSDGECNEGSVWEAAMFAAAQRLGHVTVVIDFNRWQATGRSAEVMALEPLAEKWRTFGWRSSEVDGHDLNALVRAMGDVVSDQPTAIVARTVKGKGVSFMEDDNNWHYRVPTDAEVRAACRELGLP